MNCPLPCRSIPREAKFIVASGAQRFARPLPGSAGFFAVEVQPPSQRGSAPNRWRKKMAQHLCELTQIGYVASVRTIGNNVLVRIASNANYKNGEGQWIERTFWNEHTIFERQAGLRKWAAETLKRGDLVFARSAAFQTEWEKDGETRYGQTFALIELNLLCAKADRKPKEDPEPKSRRAR
jgi:single-strand DNA-binding protein